MRRADLFPLTQQVWRHDRIRCTQAERPENVECPTNEDHCRTNVGNRGFERNSSKKMLPLAVRRRAFTTLRDKGLSKRAVCRITGHGGPKCWPRRVIVESIGNKFTQNVSPKKQRYGLTYTFLAQLSQTAPGCTISFMTVCPMEMH